jgi:flagellar basal-body rod modification protein FlgD
MSTSPVNLNAPSLTNPAVNPAASSSSSASAQSAIDALGNPDTFLTLLVAQLQYQDPESPADGTAFVTQLATFSGVEEQSAMRTDLDSINGVAQQYSASLTAAASTATTPAATTPPATTQAAPSASATGAPASGTTGTSN